jgi:molybdopterin-containing oxidoreductase family membrane subunit
MSLLHKSLLPKSPSIRTKKLGIWIALLAIVAIVGLLAYSQQLVKGLTVTGMGREIAWGLYVSNFTFLVGVAASAVILVLPYHIYRAEEFRALALIGESVAVSSVVMCILFVLVDLGRIDRIAYVVRYPNLTSVMFFDLIVLSGYLAMNAFIVGGKIFKFENPSLLKLSVYVSIPWAISIHTVTAFIYSGLIARGFWNSAILAPRFLASAFASGAAIMIILSHILGKTSPLSIDRRGTGKLSEIAAFAMVSNMFLLGVEIFTVFYSANPEEIRHFTYLLFGFGDNVYSPLWWISISAGIASTVLLITPSTRKNEIVLFLASSIVLVSIWLEKGLLLIVPAYMPSNLGLTEEYIPTPVEILITSGIWAVGLLILTALLKRVVKTLVLEEAFSPQRIKTQNRN